MKRLVHPARSRVLLLLCVLVGIVALPPAIAGAAPGDLDPSFGQGGSERLFPSEETIALRGVATQDDDKIVLAGADYAAKTVLVVRLLENGELDPSFGTGGIVNTPAPGGSGEAQAVAIQPDGKIVVVGEAKGPLTFDFLIARYNTDGAPDNTFGGGDGIETVPVGSGEARARAVTIGTGGRILAAGDSTPGMGPSEVAVAVLDPAGKPDPTFSTDGVTTLTTTPKNDRGAGIDEQTDGGIIVGDANAAGAGDGFTVFRLLPSGMPDPAFGTGGHVTTPIPGYSGAGGRVRDLVVLPDDRILAAGYGYDEVAGKTDEKVAAIRYLPGGAPDPTFGAGSGIFTAQIGPGDDSADVALPAAGDKALLVGSHEASPAGGSPQALRIDSAGALDPTFGIGGIVARPELAPFGDNVEDADLDGRERLVVLSRPYLGGGNTSVEISRFLGDVPPQTSRPPAGGGQPGGSKTAGANRAPAARIDRIARTLVAAKLKSISGTASDPDRDAIAKVQIALQRTLSAKPKARAAAVGGGRKTCLALKNAKGGFKTVHSPKGKPCPPLWLTAIGTSKWKLALKATLPPGRYVLLARAVDSLGRATDSFSRAAGNRVNFTLTAEPPKRRGAGDGAR